METVNMENKEPRRKSSILKPQKTRKPFGDLDLGNEDSDDATNANKTDRRVSFASNNFVKPFAADPEKNTIWDTTYEEAIQCSGSPRSQDIVGELNTTFSALMCSEYNDNVCDDMEFTTPIANKLCENVEDSKPVKMEVSDMDLTEIDIETVNNNNCVAITGVEMEFTMIPTEIVKTNNFLELSEAEMEFTTPVSNIFASENKSDLNHVDMALDLSRDDTEKLINYNVDSVRQSDFSKVMTGDLIPSFSNLPRMPLRGINSISFVQDLTRKEQENITLLCDTSAALISDSSLSEDNIEINDHVNVETGGTVDFLSIFDKVKMFDVQRLYQIKEHTLHVEKLAKEATPKICKQLDETTSFYLKKLEAYSKAEHILDEFFSARKKQESAQASLAQVKSLNNGSKELDILTWKDKIQKFYEGNEDHLSIKSLDGDLYEFSTLYGTIELSVQVNEEDGQILDIQLRDRIDPDKSEQIALYTHKVFMEKLQLIRIQSALGNKFEILSLLDYVRLTMEKMVQVEQEFSVLEITYGLSMDRDFKITFALISIECMFTWIFTVDVADYDQIGNDKVSYYAKVGDLKERDIKKCLNACPRGFPLIKAFVEALYNFLENIEKK